MKNNLLLIVIAILLAAPLISCSVENSRQKALPMPEVDDDSTFGIDKNINIDTIDNYLDRDDVAYIDVRMLFDSAEFSAIGGEADLTRTIRGFRIVPYPYIATLNALPVAGAYEGDCLFSITWGEDGGIASAAPNFIESELILSELFPKDKAIFLMCGGGGYSNMMKTFLVLLGWDENRIYNVGANWKYTGENALELVIHPEDAQGNKIYATWRADYAYIDFSRLHPIAA